MYEMLMRGLLKTKQTVKGFFTEEKGASEMVVVILLIVIVIAVAVIFRDSLKELVENVMKQLTDFVDETNG